MAPLRPARGSPARCRITPRSAAPRLCARLRRLPLPVALLALAACAGAATPRAGGPGPAANTGRAAEPVAAVVALATFDTAWGRIARLHYDSSFNGVDWDAVREELRPRAAEAGTTGALRAIINDMLERLGESHYGLIPSEYADALNPGGPADTTSGGTAGDLGMEVRVVEGRVVVSRVDADGPARAAGVLPGWVVQQVDTRPLAPALARIAELEGAERRLADTRFTMAANALLTGDAGKVATLHLLDADDRPVTLEVERRPRAGEPVRFGNLPTMFTEFSHERVAVGDGCVGVVRFSVWMLPVARAFDEAMDELRACDGVVIDLRGNPGGVAGMVMGVAGHFFDEVAPLGIVRSRGTELKLVANPRRVDGRGQRVEPFAGRVAILTDDASVSTSEIFAAGMQTQQRARIFGDTTAGQALPAVAVRLPNGDVLMHVIADLTGPDGRRIEGSGVAPDVDVPLTRAGLLAGRDAPLDAAIRWIAGRPAASSTGMPASAGPPLPGPVDYRWRARP